MNVGDEVRTTRDVKYWFPVGTSGFIVKIDGPKARVLYGNIELETPVRYLELVK